MEDSSDFEYLVDDTLNERNYQPGATLKQFSNATVNFLNQRTPKRNKAAGKKSTRVRKRVDQSPNQSFYTSIFDELNQSDLLNTTVNPESDTGCASGDVKRKRIESKRQTLRSRRTARDEKQQTFHSHPDTASNGLTTVDNMEFSFIHATHPIDPNLAQFKSLTISAIDNNSLATVTDQEDLDQTIPAEVDESDDQATDDRMEFYRNFASLVQAGENVIIPVQQECKVGRQRSLNTVDAAAPAAGVNKKGRGSTKLSRRTTWTPSTSQMQMANRVSFGDYLWLHLQAWKYGKSIKPAALQQSLQEIDDEIVEKRTTAMSVLNEIKQFTFDCCMESESLAVESVNHTFHVSSLIDSIYRQNLALFVIERMFTRFDDFLALFPDYKSFLIYLADIYTNDVRDRLLVLQIWSNLSRDMACKMKSIGRMLEMHRAKHSADYWPNLNYDSPEPEASRSSSTTNMKQGHPVQSPLSNDESTPMSSRSASSSRRKRLSSALFSNYVEEDTSSQISMYTFFVEKSLKLRGMRKVLLRILKLLVPTLNKIKLTLQKQRQPTQGRVSKTKDESFYLQKFGHNHSAFKQMGLPNYFCSFLFLLKIPFNLTHEWLKIRISQKQATSPDPVTLDQLIQDCRDCLTAAVEVKMFYHSNIVACCEDVDMLDQLLIDETQQFENDLLKMFDVYLEYVRLWAKHQTSHYQMTTEWSQSLINGLEKEWRFTKKIAVNILSGEADAARRFCHINKEMYQSIEDSLEEINDMVINIMMKDEAGSESIMSSLEDGSVDQTDVSIRNSTSKVFNCCRLVRNHLHDVREMALRALAFSKVLRKEFEITLKFQIGSSLENLLARLLETDYYLIKITNSKLDFLIFCKSQTASDEPCLQALLNITCGKESSTGKTNSHHVLLINCKNVENVWQKWQGNVKTVTLGSDANLALNNLDTEGSYVVFNNSVALVEYGADIISKIGDKLLMPADEQCSCHEVVADCLTELKTSALKLGSKIDQWLQCLEDYANLDNTDRQLDEKEKQTYRDTLAQVYNFAFEYSRDLHKILTSELRQELMVSSKDLAQRWSSFVGRICDRGHGSRPRWANDGLNFLVFVSQPAFTALLSEDEFSSLKQIINTCVEHIIGSKPEAVIRHTLTTPENTGSVHRAISWPRPQTLANGNHSENNNANRKPKRSITFPVRSSVDFAISPPESTSRENLQTSFDENAEKARNDSLMAKIDQLEREREILLANEKLVGRLVERQHLPPQRQIALKKANFAWQRMNNRIGFGSFGSVYTAIRLDTTELIAVKQIKFQRQNHQALQSLVDEVTNFEAIRHENLVRYYGVEVHRDELFIFMEYCNEGTMERLCCEGLSEDSVRIYTLHLLKGVCELHRRGIVHRDIKSGNIFLSSNYTLKLGDFGSSVRLKGSTTRVGELTLHVGTPAYMAPEVCTGCQDGYGRAADVWSVGCVVLEMSTGKPPWHECNDAWQIVWKVGNGGVPDVPETLGSNCKHFLRCCLQTQSANRPNAEQLLEHPFVKVKQDL